MVPFFFFIYWLILRCFLSEKEEIFLILLGEGKINHNYQKKGKNENRLKYLHLKFFFFLNFSNGTALALWPPTLGPSVARVGPH